MADLFGSTNDGLHPSYVHPCKVKETDRTPQQPESNGLEPRQGELVVVTLVYGPLETIDHDQIIVCDRSATGAQRQLEAFTVSGKLNFALHFLPLEFFGTSTLATRSSLHLLLSLSFLASMWPSLCPRSS